MGFCSIFGLLLVLLVVANPLDPCQYVECSSGKSCYFGICVNNQPPSPPPPGAKCNPPCGTREQCTFGICTASANPPTPNSTLCDPPCDKNSDCRWQICLPRVDAKCPAPCDMLTQDCRNGMCVERHFDNLPCFPDCPDFARCSYGICLPVEDAPCTQCRDPFTDCKFGVCVPQLSPCVPPCGLGNKCVLNGTDPICVPQKGACSGTCDNSTEVCLFEQCVKCPLCKELEDRVVDALGNANFNLSDLNGSALIDRWEIIVMNATKILVSNVSDTLQRLRSDLVQCANMAAMALSPNIELHIADLISDSQTPQNCAIFIARASSILSNMTISVDNIVQVLFDTYETELAVAVKTFNRLVINGTLLLSGSGRVQFPSAHDLVQFSEGALIQASGNIRLDGFSAGVTISISEQQGMSAQAQVAVGDYLRVQGNVLGSDGNFYVDGQVTTSGLAFQPQLTVGPTGVFEIIGDSFQGGNLAMLGGRVRIEASGPVTYFRQILSCLKDSFIEYRFNGTLQEVFVNATAENPVKGIICKYDAITALLLDKFECAVKLVDDFGNSKTLQSAIETETSRRQLLSTPEGSSLAVWTSSELQYSVSNNAVDEPSTFPVYGYVLIILGCLGMAGAGFFYCRRKARAQHKQESMPLFDGSNTGGAYTKAR